MTVSGATQSASLDRSISEQTSPEPLYKYVDGGFYYTFAHSTRGREFISLPGLTETQVQELVKKEGISFFPSENLDGNYSFAFTHGWQVGSNNVGIVAEDGVLCCTVYDEVGRIISDEEIPQIDDHSQPLPAGEIYCKYSRSTPFVNTDGKVKFLFLTWKWEEKELSLTENENDLIWQIFDKKSNTTSWTAFKNAQLYRPEKRYYVGIFGRFFSQFRDTALDHGMEKLWSLEDFDREECPLFPVSLIYKVIRYKIAMLVEILSDFTLDNITIEGNQLRSLQLRPCFTKSRFDPITLIDKDTCAITLINNESNWHGHAQLIVEMIKKQQYYMYVGHLAKSKNKGQGEVKWSKIVDPNHFHYTEKAFTHSLPKKDAERIIQSINKEIKIQKKGDTAVFFNARGAGKLFRQKMIQTDKGPRPVHNCITWARDKLLIVGIQLEIDNYSLYTTPRKYTKPNAKYFI